jgi:XTP/dITP diphosphohydrolase
MKLVFATNNMHKLLEARQILGQFSQIVSLDEVGFNSDIEETGNTLEENAKIKAETIYAATNFNCFADDTGLEIEVLNNRPGVFSARYAGINHDFEANIDKVLGELADATNRRARFRTSICLIYNKKEYLFEGIVKGEILHKRVGSGGFGYDSIFRPDGFCKSFAELDAEEKNRISHRGLALKNMADYISKFLLND